MNKTITNYVSIEKIINIRRKSITSININNVKYYISNFICTLILLSINIRYNKILLIISK